MDAFWVGITRDVVSISGPDAGSYLQSQVSQDLRALAVGEAMWTFVLEPTGRVEVLARVRRTGDEEFRLDTDTGFGDVLRARLQRFKIRVQAELSAVETMPGIAVRRAPDDTSSVDADLLGAEVDPPADLAAGTERDLLAARIAAVWPAMGSEIAPGETIPAETGITGAAVSFTKGCYPGQELVERMDSRGASAPRLLQRVEVVEGTEPGDELVRDGVAIGVVTSVVGTDALAYVKRSALGA